MWIRLDVSEQSLQVLSPNKVEIGVCWKEASGYP